MQFYNWILGCVLIYTTLFGIGKLVFKEWTAAHGVHRRGGGRRGADLAKSLASELER